MSQQFKVVLLGAAGSGKTTFLTRHITGDFTKAYVPTVGAQVHALDFNTNKGVVIFYVWDTAGQEKIKGLTDAYYNQARACIVFCDLTRQETLKEAVTLAQDFRKVSPDAPMVLVGNKADSVDVKVSMKRLSATAKKIGTTSCYFISAKSNYNFEKPFLDIARHYLGQDTVLCASDPKPIPSSDPSYDSDLDSDEEDEMVTVTLTVSKGVLRGLIGDGLVQNPL
jgi:GTP-binding nuclear protein Ran